MYELLLTALLAFSSVDPELYESNDDYLVDLFDLENSENVNLVRSGPDTTSFANADDIELFDYYLGTFSNKNDIDYLKFNVPSRGYYKILISCDRPINMMIYTSSDGVNTTLYTQYTEATTDDNYGYNYGIYVDTTSVDYLFFAFKANGEVFLNKNYVATVAPFNRHSTPINEFVRYDVTKKTYAYINYSYVDDYTTTTTGYNPFGSSSFNLPSGVNGDNKTVGLGTYYDVNVDPKVTYPYSTIGRINIGGTGFLVDSNIYITAAHCVYDYANNQWHTTSLTNPILFGKYENNYSYQGYIKYVFYDSLYLISNASYMIGNETDANYDFAICVLDDDYGDDIGYLPIKRSSSSLFDTSSLLVVDGYKSTSYYQTLSYSNYISIDSRNNTVIDYFKNTAGGDSGAPILYNDNVVGVNTGITGTYSFGTVFTDIRYFWTKKIMEDY